MRALSLIAALAIVISLFLPTLAMPGGGPTPWNFISSIEPSLQGIVTFVRQSPIGLLALVVSFILPAVFILVTAFIGPVRGLAVLAGALPMALTAYAVWQLYRQNAAFSQLTAGLDLGDAGASLANLPQIALQVFGYGAWAWLIGAMILLLTGLVGFAQKR